MPFLREWVEGREVQDMESIKYFYANVSTEAAAETSSCIVYVVAALEVSHKK